MLEQSTLNENNTLSVKKSNVFLRAARSITKTKSVSGNFIVKTMICKSANNNNNTTVAHKRQQEHSGNEMQTETTLVGNTTVIDIAATNETS